MKAILKQNSVSAKVANANSNANANANSKTFREISSIITHLA